MMAQLFYPAGLPKVTSIFYLLIIAIALVAIWASRNMHHSPKAGQPPMQSLLMWLALVLPAAGVAIVFLIMIQLQEYQYLPGLLILVVSTGLVFRSWSHQKRGRALCQKEKSAK